MWLKCEKNVKLISSLNLILFINLSFDSSCVYKVQILNTAAEENLRKLIACAWKNQKNPRNIIGPVKDNAIAVVWKQEESKGLRRTCIIELVRRKKKKKKRKDATIWKTDNEESIEKAEGEMGRR